MSSNQKNTASLPYIFKRTKIKIKNRTVLAAMTNKQSHSNGIISNEEINWLNERSKGGFGIITTAATNVSKEGQAWEGEFGIYDDIHLPNLTKLTSTVKLNGSLIFAQLFHGGLRCPQKLTNVIPISASKIKCQESKSGFSREADINDIKKIIHDFTSAAVRCVDAGFDGVELHGAHGYLISQFLGTKTNQRNDEWGGDLNGRSKLLVEIYKSIKNSVPDSFIIGIRISPIIESIGINLQDTISLIKILKTFDLDYIHLSCWDSFLKYDYKNFSEKTITEIIRESFDNLPTIISTGSIWSSDNAENVLNQGADLIGVARVGIPYPYWPKNISNINYNPKKPPFSIKTLKKAKLSKVFIDYMRNWKDFVID